MNKQMKYYIRLLKHVRKKEYSNHLKRQQKEVKEEEKEEKKT